MKKLLIIATLSITIAFSTIGYAYDLDLKSLSDDEIAQLFTDIEQEIVDRNINKSSDLLPGTYIGGVDIPVGGYDIHADSDDESFDIDVHGDGPKGIYYSFSEIASSNEPADYHFSIKDGEVLSISGRTATITINNGLNFK